jgi:hypothetical protein
MTGTPPSINIGTIGSWCSETSSVHSAVEREALNNSEKLTAAEANERHLFLWVDDTDPTSVEELTNFRLPKANPELPVGIDVVWVALWMRNVNSQSNTYALWHVTPDLGWKIERTPAVRAYAEAVGA